MADALNAFGATIQRDAVEIAYVTNIGGPGLARDTLESTHHKSIAMYRTFIKGLKDGGEVSLDLNFDPTNATHNAAAGILADFANDTDISEWIITWPDIAATTWTFDGIVTGFEPSAPFDDKLSATVTIKVSGQPTLA